MNERKGYKAVKYTTHEQDKELVKSALAGNQRSYNILLSKYKPILYTAAQRRLSHKPVEDLEDIVMIVLGQAFVRINQYDPTKSLFFTWIVACLHNYINGIPGHKKRIKADSLEDLYPSNQETEETIEYNIPDEDVFDLEMDRQQTFKLIRALVDKLPKESADIIKLKYFRELSYSEIAEAMAIDETHVWYKLKKAKDQLKKISDDDLLF